MTDIETLESRAQDMRRDIVQMIHDAGSGHPGGSLSCIDILAALYLGGVMNHDPEDPDMEGRDRLILSKGHAAPALYAVLANAGYFPKEELATLRKLGSRLQGHPDKNLLPGIEASTGSLGQGLSIACGMALGIRLEGGDQTVFAILGDGECQEGQVWEAAMFAAHMRASNLVAIIDSNGLQIDGRVQDVCNPEDIGEKFKAFGWDIVHVNGHDIAALADVLGEAKNPGERPIAVIARTVKGKGVSYMENQASWHGKAPNDYELEVALRDICGDGGAQHA